MAVDPTYSPGYLAGFFDGEGTLGIYGSTPRVYQLQVSIRQNESPEAARLLVWLQERYGGSVTRADKEYCANPQMAWSIRGTRAVPFLRDIRPHLGLKAEQVDVALDFQARKGEPPVDVSGRRIERSEDYLEFASLAEQKLKELKRPWAKRTS